MDTEKIVLLVGGVGGAKLAYGLAQIVKPENLTIIVNTGDDFWHYGLKICPDLDTITYTLSNTVDRNQGWGVANDTTTTMDRIAQFGEDLWFKLGNLDLATHLFRTKMLREETTLTEITSKITSALGISCTVLPMANEPVSTIVDTKEYGPLAFQEYFVKYRWQPVLKNLTFAGAEYATISPEIRTAIEEADAIIVGPSNPWLSIQPILNIPGLRDLITSRNIPRVAVTPIIDGDAVKGPTAKIMKEIGHEVSAETVIQFYGDVINGFVYDERDSLNGVNLQTTAFDTYMINDEKRIELAQNVLFWLKDWILQP